MVRGTTRSKETLRKIEAGGLEPALADPVRIVEVLELVGDVTVVFWLMGTASHDLGSELHGARLERLLEELVDTPVRGVVYEAAGTVKPEVLDRGQSIVEAASETWRIPARIVTANLAYPQGWTEAMAAAAASLISA